MLRCAAFANAVAIVANVARAFAQIDPDDDGAGTKLGMAQRSNSGQVGTVTLFPSGAQATLIVVTLFSEPARAREPAAIARARDCDARSLLPAYRLKPVVRGTSRTVVATSATQLFRGYVIDVRAADRSTRRVSCGELRH